MIVSSIVGIVFALILFRITMGFSFDKKGNTIIFLLLFWPLKLTMYYMFFPFVMAMGYAGYKIPIYSIQENSNVYRIAKAHALSSNLLIWSSWIIVYYSFGFGEYGHFYGIVTPLIGFPLGLLLFPVSVSYLIVLISVKVTPED